MSQRQSWRRFLPDPRHLLLAGGLAFVVLAVVGFASLYQFKAEALAEQAVVATQVAQLEAQNQHLKSALDAGQQKQNIDAEARLRFKMGLPGEKRIVAEPDHRRLPSYRIVSAAAELRLIGGSGGTAWRGPEKNVACLKDEPGF